ncbi:MAG: ATP-binding cassette domain-containing protein [Pseudomonadota bacterium]
MISKIVVQDLKKAFGNHKVLQGINLEIEAGSSVVILGGSGTGKSVLIKAIVGLIQPDSGKVCIDGKETTFLNTRERFEVMAKCGFLFQASALFDSLSVMDNITFFAEKLYKLSPSAKRDLAEEKLRSVGLKPLILDLFPAELSGGMQKRVSLARAICTNPEIIFFDEPTTGLDPIMANVINELIIKVREELGATTITITHDLASAEKIASVVNLIHEGKILWSGSREEMHASDNPYLMQFLSGSTKGPIEVDVG